MIVDFHVHCFSDELAGKAIPALAGCANIEPLLDGTVGGIKNSMRASGVDYSVILSIATKPSQTERINDWSADIQKEGVIAFGSVHPEYVDFRAELTRIKGLGLKGIKLHPEYQKFYVDEARMFPIYEKAFELGLIIVFHAGEDIGLPPPYHSSPERLLRLIRDFPGGKFVAAHMGSYAMWDDVEKYLVGEDIYFDTSYSFKCLNEGQAKRIIGNHDFKKILFGTDSPWCGQDDEIQRLKALCLGKDVENAILGENARILLGI